MTGTNLTNLRRIIYLTIMNALGYEEAVHKLLKVQLDEGQEIELVNMVIECCSQERSYSKFYGLVSERLCKLNRVWYECFVQAFGKYYETIHRYETNRLRNISRLFGHLIASDSISWIVFEAIKMNEDDTTSSSRIFVKIMMTEIQEAMGLKTLVERFQDPEVKSCCRYMFPMDNPKNTRFAINYFTSIGLGAITEEMREHLKVRLCMPTWDWLLLVTQNAPRLIMEQRKALMEEESSESDTDSDSSSSDESSSGDSYSSSGKSRSRGRDRSMSSSRSRSHRRKRTPPRRTYSPSASPPPRSAEPSRDNRRDSRRSATPPPRYRDERARDMRENAHAQIHNGRPIRRSYSGDRRAKYRDEREESPPQRRRMDSRERGRERERTPPSDHRNGSGAGGIRRGKRTPSPPVKRREDPYERIERRRYDSGSRSPPRRRRSVSYDRRR